MCFACPPRFLRKPLKIMHPELPFAHQQGRARYIYQRSPSITDRPESYDKPKARKKLTESQIPKLFSSQRPAQRKKHADALQYRATPQPCSRSRYRHDCSDKYFLFYTRRYQKREEPTCTTTLGLASRI